MGQQQLLLIVLGVIIVGIAIAVGISMFKSNAQTSNCDQLINDLNNLAAKAEQYFRKPTAMAGGGQSFYAFTLAPIDTINGNGMYAITAIGSGSTTAPTLGAYPTSGSINTSSGTVAADTMIQLCGWGNELGNDGIQKVQAWVLVTNNVIQAHVLN